MNSVQTLREAESAKGPPSAAERRKCKSRVTLLLRDADSCQIDHKAAEPTHGPHQPCTSSSWLGAGGTLLAILLIFNCTEVVSSGRRVISTVHIRALLAETSPISSILYLVAW